MISYFKKIKKIKELLNKKFYADEPFYAHFLKKTKNNHPMREEIIKHYLSDYNQVVEYLTRDIPNKKTIWYQKHMAHHIMDFNKINWIKECEIIFDYIFLDPPFDFQKLSQVLKFIDNKRLLKTSGKIFIESPKTIHPIEMKNFKVIKEKIVGDVKGQLIKWK